MKRKSFLYLVLILMIPVLSNGHIVVNAFENNLIRSISNNKEPYKNNSIEETQAISVTASTTSSQYCSGSIIEFTANVSEGQSPYTWSWNGPDGFTSDVQNPIINDAAILATGTYTVTVTDASSSTASATVTITVNESPNPTATNTGPYCAGEIILLATESYSSYSWTGPSGFSSTEQNPARNNMIADYAGDYIVTVTASNGCTGSATTQVEFSPAPIVNASNSGPYCEGETIRLGCDLPGLPSYSWTGPNNYTSSASSPTISNSNPSMSGTYYLEIIGANGCSAQSSTEVVVDPAVDATITPLGNVCLSNPVVILNAGTNGGIWTGTGVAHNLFYPSVAGPGTHTISYSISAGACFATSSANISVLDEVYVMNFSDRECDPLNENYRVSFDVVNSSDQPVGFLLSYNGGAASSHTGNYEITVPSRTPYNIVVTDLNNKCNNYEFSGKTDCGCNTYAGTMSSIQLQQLCMGENSSNVAHNGDQVLDGNDGFQFILHDGNTPLNIIKRNSTPEFINTDIAGFVPGNVYYISAIAGNLIGASGDVNINDTCFSMSPGTPVLWREKPIASLNMVNRNPSVCNNTIELRANPAATGMTGYWSAETEFILAPGYAISDPTVVVLVSSNNYGSHKFKWNVVNGDCIASDSLTVNFLQTPTVNAGSPFSVCGTTAILNANVPPNGAIGEWTVSSGSGIFTPSNSPTATVNSTYGSHVYIWTVSLGQCMARDSVKVTFVREPNPSVYTSLDFVCGQYYDLSVHDIYGTGYWAAFDENNQQIQIAGYDPSNESSNTRANVGFFSEPLKTVKFVWNTSIDYQTMTCSDTASTTVNFMRVPTASISGSERVSVCGNCVDLEANMTGTFGTGRWESTTSGFDQNVTWDPSNEATNTRFCFSNDALYRDGKAEAKIFWYMINRPFPTEHPDKFCMSSDSVIVSFFQKPKPEAGNPIAVCGNSADLSAVFKINETSNYTPVGKWFEAENPGSGLSNITQTDSPSNANKNAAVTVTGYGIWKFLFRESNAGIGNCSDSDTVTVEFIQNPTVSVLSPMHICGDSVRLRANDHGSTHGGQWHATITGTFIPDHFPAETSFKTNVISESNPVVYAAFTRTVFNNNNGTAPKSCSASATQEVTFYKQPTARITSDREDNKICGNKICGKPVAELPGSNYTGIWESEAAQISITDPTLHNAACFETSRYGSYDVIWRVYIPGQSRDFCSDTAKYRINFVQQPVTNAGDDISFCGTTGVISFNPSIGTISWQSTQDIRIGSPNTASTGLDTEGSYGDYALTVVENNNGCTDQDTKIVSFVEPPSSEVRVVPPRCFGEPAVITALEGDLPIYHWNTGTGIMSDFETNAEGGIYRAYVYWDLVYPTRDTVHTITLIVENSAKCTSPHNEITITEPRVPESGNQIFKDTCALGKGKIIFGEGVDWNVEYSWINTEVGTPSVDGSVVTDIPAGVYDIKSLYASVNSDYYSDYNNYFDGIFCTDTVEVEIDLIGMIEALMEVSPLTDVNNLVVPASVGFNNLSEYDGVSKVCEWYFGDGTPVLRNNCDNPTHVYQTDGEFEPKLVVMNKNLIACRDTFVLTPKIVVGKESKLEIPNVFSPNGDGINDYFQVNAESLERFEGKILDRWGVKMFEWTNWRDENAGWDGKNNGGSRASSGVYYFIIKAKGLDGSEYKEEGFLHLMGD